MQIAILFSALLIIFGIVSLMLARKLRGRSLNLFFSALFLQVGLFLLLNTANAINIEYSKAWPLLSIFTGMALLPSGWHRYHGFKANYVVTSAAFIILGVIMMIFALKLTPFPLLQFARDWWVLLVLLTILITVLTSLGSRFSRKAVGSGDTAEPKE